MVRQTLSVRSMQQQRGANILNLCLILAAIILLF